LDTDDFIVETVDEKNRANLLTYAKAIQHKAIELSKMAELKDEDDENAIDNILAQAKAIEDKAIELSKMPELKDMKAEAKMRMMPLHSTIDLYDRVVGNQRRNIMASCMYIHILKGTMSTFNDLIAETKLEVAFFTRRLAAQQTTVTQLDEELSSAVNGIFTNRLRKIDAEIKEYDESILIGYKGKDASESVSDYKTLQAALSGEIATGYQNIINHINERCQYLHDIDATTSIRVGERKIELYREHMEKYADLISKEEELLVQHHNKISAIEVDLSMFKVAIQDSKYR
jgi:hypothetical protein